MNTINGKDLAAVVRGEVKVKAQRFLDEFDRKPALHVVLVGEDPASQIYVRNKKRACKRARVDSVQHLLPESTTQEELLELIARLNGDEQVDGILVQLPLPEQIDENIIIEAIDPRKDADGFHPINLGRLVAGQAGLVPCTPLGCMRMIAETGVSLVGKNAVVVGRSTIVGKPVAHLLLAEHATVTICHSRTRDLAGVISEADVLIAAVGRPEMIKGKWVKKGAVVIDVGINRLDDGTLVGDVEFEEAAQRAAWISPVPGGVGPMTIAYLLENTLTAAFARANQTG